MMIAAILSILFSSASTAATPSSQSIIVTGRVIQDKKAALTACLARNCPPNEDIDASLALAETQLLAGKYHDAREALLAALGRNKKEAMNYPIPVSDLYRANGRVAAHLGIDDDYFRSTWGIYNTLKKGVPNAKDLQYSAMMEVAEMVATTRGHDRAREYYRSIAYHARQDGRPDIAALAELRMILRHFPAYARPEAIREIAGSTDPKTCAAQLEARLALARIAFEHNDLRAADAQISEISKLGLKRPVLVYSPPWEAGGGPTNPDSAPTLLDRRDVLPTNSGEPGSHGRGAVAMLPNGPHAFGSYRMPLNVKDMWIDVGFRITEQGTVADLQTLRSRGEIGWAKPLLTSIAGRRYTPAKAGSPDSVRTERYTYTSGLENETGTRSSQHSPNARVEYFDLSDISAAN